MKKAHVVLSLCLMILLSGCSKEAQTMERALALRTRLLSAEAYQFDVQISADFGEIVYDFSLECWVEKGERLTFSVTEPETIAGITGRIDAQGGALTFDDTALTFPLLADGKATPIGGAWLLVRSLQTGCLTACTRVDDKLMLSVDDSYEDDAFQLNIWLGAEDLPVSAEIFRDGSRILSLSVRNFTFQ